VPYPHLLSIRGRLPRVVMRRAAPSPFAVTLRAVFVVETETTISPDPLSGILTLVQRIEISACAPSKLSTQRQSAQSAAIYARLVAFDVE
jgi:hypothetical protein